MAKVTPRVGHSEDDASIVAVQVECASLAAELLVMADRLGVIAQRAEDLNHVVAGLPCGGEGSTDSDCDDAHEALRERYGITALSDAIWAVGWSLQWGSNVTPAQARRSLDELRSRLPALGHVAAGRIAS